MKTLLIGLDGGHEEIFKRGWTPFITQSIRKGQNIKVYNNLVSRGWLEIVTGRDAEATGALYDKPTGDGTLNWNLKFSFGDSKLNDTSVSSLWEELNLLGVKVGIMNVPTVFPAPKVDGFFVSGGGGGAPVTKMIQKELCYPEDIFIGLRRDKYIVDQRIPELVNDANLTKAELIFGELDRMNEIRTRSFTRLSHQFNIDFGFLVYKTSSVTIETILNSEKHINPIEINNAAKKYYNNLDNYIKQLSIEFPEATIIITSDHGTVERTHTFNPNILLQKNDLQQRKNPGLKSKLFSVTKGIIPFWLKSLIKSKTNLANEVLNSTRFESSNTIAFCKTRNDWNHGIYINDNVRFSGPVDVKDKSYYEDLIISTFNNQAELVNHGITARKRMGGKNPLFPDIIFDIPNGYLTSDESKKMVCEFQKSSKINGLSCILKGEIYSMKSHNPLWIILGKTTLKADKDIYTLTDLNKFIINEFKS